jgi:ribonuclease E
MSKKMLINATHPEENRVAIVEDGLLTELDIEIEGREQTRGNIYKAVVVRVETGLQAAFIDYGAERLGFLQMGEIHPSLFPDEEGAETKGRKRIADVLRQGQELLVQVVKDERANKGAALTTFFSLPGRYIVLMPGSDTKGVSRKIEEADQRKKLKEDMASLDFPPNMGYIVRTAGIDPKREDLKQDFEYLLRVYENIQTLGAKAKGPCLIYKESNLVIRSIRDYFTSDIDEVLVDDPKVFSEAKDFFQQVMPEYARLVKLHQERRPIFSRYQIEEQIETISKNRVNLPSGGSIVIDATEALVAIDVNSGKMAGEQGVEATAYKTNLEAAAEAGRQLRLRDLGGLIVIDFIDMRDRKHIRDIEKAIKDALKTDKARVTVGRISRFGLLEMSRQRIRPVLAEGSFLPCPHCSGSGRIKSPEAMTVAFLRKLQAGVAKGQIDRIDAEIPLDVATYLLNAKREEILEMEHRYNLSIFVTGRPDFVAGQMEIEFHKRDKDLPGTEAVELASGALEATGDAVGAPPVATAAENPKPAEEVPRKKRKRRRRKKNDKNRVGAAPASANGQETENGKAGAAPLPASVAQPEQSATQDVAPTKAVPAPVPSAPAESGENVEKSLTASEPEKPVETGSVIEVPVKPASRAVRPAKRARRPAKKPVEPAEAGSAVQPSKDVAGGVASQAASAPETGEKAPDRAAAKTKQAPVESQPLEKPNPAQRRRRAPRKPTAAKKPEAQGESLLTASEAKQAAAEPAAKPEPAAGPSLVPAKKPERQKKAVSASKPAAKPGARSRKKTPTKAAPAKAAKPEKKETPADSDAQPVPEKKKTTRAPARRKTSAKKKTAAAETTQAKEQSPSE